MISYIPTLIKEATIIKRNFLDLVDLELTYVGWCFKVIPFLTDYDRLTDHQEAYPCADRFSGHNQAPWCPQPLKKI